MPNLGNYWSPAIPVSRNQLIHRALSPLGLAAGADAESDNTALAALDECVNDLNTRLWEFNKRVTTGLTMTASQNYLSLPDSVYKVNFVHLVDATDSTHRVPLGYVSWPDYVLRTAEINMDEDEPRVWAHRNMQREGRIYLWPVPDTDAVADYTVTMEWYQRIPLVSAEDPIQIPREVENALVFQARALLLLDHGDEARAQHYFALSQAALNDAMNGDRVEPDEQKAFRLIDDRPRGDFYTKWHLHI